MPTVDTYRKQAKQLVRWHRERNYSIGALNTPLPLTLAQEIVAVEAGFPSWAALKAAADNKASSVQVEGEPKFGAAVPILFVRDVAKAAAFYADQLGFQIDFLHGNPAFYGAVSRGLCCLHLRFVHKPNFAELAAREASLIVATIEVRSVKALFEQYERQGVGFTQRLVRQAWGGIDFHVRDLDGKSLRFGAADPLDSGHKEVVVASG